MKKLEMLRQGINDLDERLVGILEERMKLALEIADFKQQNGMAIYDAKREQEILRDRMERYEGLLSPKQWAEFFEMIFRISKALQYERMARKNLILIGFMGTGKTSVGRYLADRKGAVHIDLDARIEEESGVSVAEIFEQQGERAFRQIETQVLQEVYEQIRSDIEKADRKGYILSCGGGSVLDPANVDLLRTMGSIVWLTASPKSVYERLASTSDRPLLRHRKSMESIAKLMQQRESVYEKVRADLVIDTSDQSIEAVGEKILKAMSERMPHFLSPAQKK